MEDQKVKKKKIPWPTDGTVERDGLVQHQKGMGDGIEGPPLVSILTCPSFFEVHKRVAWEQGSIPWKGAGEISPRGLILRRLPCNYSLCQISWVSHDIVERPEEMSDTSSSHLWL